ncbi:MULTISPECIES: LysR family transcriptional regulator [Psychrobacter]|jgi:DNA-binding transcriptional LysR family regulator|uniref:LysR family transcriptional regulator n=1 Tax=Psychrobacter TaxID=497 RepID=UPI00086A6FFD|nr:MULTISPECIES: LysR family transcriptional regulator [Psychrobacter]MBA6244693.1 LysR family transcriptional regulator [Psychrobacter sp. Urea-trap-18]MBA6285830.1 LysR family transcriptional regulator [Psychrobacter sp. Urea-trap-16]MBA6318698.1 LysR family transcriptional regulator [Psychrobacter sp. Urea-trap-20]MBA6334915.1 LysR family transcriptional regulator [Psychrobacter sp. Urea-trap-19]MCG3843120.1 LysR family transcriptional regulator [Psychrobacter sp. Ps1]|tara:strand:- start:389 stop:1294 length:906 start_codon:yes stop_codon:yes gene_type:complete
MGQLEDMAMFVRIVEAGSITKAAEQLNIAKSAVSRRLKELEERLGSQLISRTTRQSKLTQAGEQYYQQVNNILRAVDAVNEHATDAPMRIEGTLKMTAPLSFGLMHLNDVIDKYANKHPNLRFDLDFSDRRIDLIEEGYELAIRIGELQDSSYQAKKLALIRCVICASPDYLARMGMPETLDDLDNHALLQYSLGQTNSINLVDTEGRSHHRTIDAKIKATNGEFLVDLAVKGHGITFVPTFIAYKQLALGELVPVFQHYQLPTLTAYAVYPKNRFLSQRCRYLIDFIAEQFGDNPYWDQY